MEILRKERMESWSKSLLVKRAKAITELMELMEHFDNPLKILEKANEEVAAILRGHMRDYRREGPLVHQGLGHGRLLHDLALAEPHHVSSSRRV